MGFHVNARDGYAKYLQLSVKYLRSNNVIIVGTTNHTLGFKTHAVGPRMLLASLPDLGFFDVFCFIDFLVSWESSALPFVELPA